MNACRDFEREMWLYIDGSLPEAKMTYWGDHLSSCSDCRSLMESTVLLLKDYDSMAFEDIRGDEFDRAIGNAVRQGNLWGTIKSAVRSFFSPSDSESAQIIKIAFGSALAVAAIVLLLLSEKPNPVKNVAGDLLDWEGVRVNNQINEVRDRIDVINKDKWSREIYTLDKNIDRLESGKDKFSFN